MMDYAKAYRQLHARNRKIFGGFSIVEHVPAIAELVNEFKPDRILDYGCGKGLQYTQERVHDQWGGLMPALYDPGVKALSRKPEGKFGGIICTDVLEHIEEFDLPEILDDIFGYAADEAFVFFNVACRPAKSKRLSDGRNVHVTVKPPEWWETIIGHWHRDGLTIKTVYDQERYED